MLIPIRINCKATITAKWSMEHYRDVDGLIVEQGRANPVDYCSSFLISLQLEEKWLAYFVGLCIFCFFVVAFYMCYNNYCHYSLYIPIFIECYMWSIDHM